jgi:type IV fimbrial biogenesis protein FimT
MTHFAPNFKDKGFSLIELMVVVAIFAILISVAVPSMVQMVMSNRVQAAATEFQTAVSIARAESIKRGGDTRVTVVANTKVSGTPDWRSGVTVFFDINADANGDAPSTDNTKLIMRTSALATGMQAVTNFNSIGFNGLGRSVNSTGGAFAGTAAFGSENADWRCVIISMTGRVRTVRLTRAAYDVTGCPAS